MVDAKLTDGAKGIYVGVQGYPGMGDPKDASILKGTTLRGVQPTNDHGVASFDSLFPGHYDGRATHIHGNTSPTFSAISAISMMSMC